MSRTRKKSPTGSRQVDPSCANHGSCPRCRGDRTYGHRHRAPVVAAEDFKPACTSVDRHAESKSESRAGLRSVHSRVDPERLERILAKTT